MRNESLIKERPLLRRSGIDEDQSGWIVYCRGCGIMQDSKKTEYVSLATVALNLDKPSAYAVVRNHSRFSRKSNFVRGATCNIRVVEFNPTGYRRLLSKV